MKHIFHTKVMNESVDGRNRVMHLAAGGIERIESIHKRFERYNGLYKRRMRAYKSDKMSIFSEFRTPFPKGTFTIQMSYPIVVILLASFSRLFDSCISIL